MADPPEAVTPKAPKQTKQMNLQDMDVAVIKQYPGQQQVDRAVKVKVPGKHFPSLTLSEQREFYEVTAVEYTERHRFAAHNKAWGAAHTGPGLRFICGADAIEDPDNRGFWTTLALWNRWRHETYKNQREAELVYLDELPSAATASPTTASPAEQTKQEPEIKKHFTVTSTGTHTISGAGKNAGKTRPCAWYACNQSSCKRGIFNPIKQVAFDTGGLFQHLQSCNPELCMQLRARSTNSSVQIDEHGEVYSLYNLQELLPHHCRYVEKCFRGFDHFYETRSDNGLKEFVQGYDRRASLPHEQTCMRILGVYDELVDEKLQKIIDAHIARFGRPCAGSTGDVWSLKSCRESFYCQRASFVLDGDMLSELTGDQEYKGTIVDCAPLLAFRRFRETHHTGAALARWKSETEKSKNLQNAIGLATEDGASNNKKANKILNQDQAVCAEHDLARCVLIASGETGKPNANPAMASLNSRSGKQAATFSRSVVANQDLKHAVAARWR